MADLARGCLVLLLALAFGLPAQAACRPSPWGARVRRQGNPADVPLGRARCFTPESMTVSNGRYALQVTFAEAKAVAPQATPGGASDGQSMPPLTMLTYPDLGDGILCSTYQVATGAFRKGQGDCKASTRLCSSPTTLSAPM